MADSGNKKFRILSIDGGGLRGVYSAHILKRIEEELGVDWLVDFDMLAGTSTGSIIAAGLASGISAKRLFEFYKEHGVAIFKSRLCSRLDVLKIFTSKYSSKRLYRLLEAELGDVTLGEITVPLILPSVDIGNGNVYVFKSKYDDGFVRDPKVKVSDAVLASCSAPTFFDPHLVDGKYLLADGGLWANNPALIAAIDANYRLNIPLENIRILSIGTGKSNVFYPQKTNWLYDWFVRSWQGWGFATRWGRSKLIDLILNLQSDAAHNMVCLMLGENPLEPKKICRITFESNKRLPMDSACKLDDWISQADKDFTHRMYNIREFFEINKLGDKSDAN